MKSTRLAAYVRPSLLLVLVCAAGSAAAEWYQVEVIAFRYLQQEAGSWAAAKVLPDFSNAVRLTPASADTADRAYQSLAGHELELAGAYQVLARSDRLQTLFHSGWRQRGEDGRAVFLSTTPSSEEAGNVESAPSMERPSLAGSVRVRPVATGQAFQLGTSFVVQEGATPVALVESRKMVVDELHYLDHPLVGLLIQVSALAPDTADGAAATLSPATDGAETAPR